ncbi:MAG: CusA/CzcA family heavy metal efflux RND transporter [Candidatus Kapabacteria bacterium]|nr:CusA/CzcA family heavy metal efflux RND transporter [Candidatus Kapabacteria bacterium]
MFRRIISFSISNPLIVGLGVIGLIIWGMVSLRSLPIDAVPDITNNQVQIVTRSPALAPQEVEKLITTPVELTMASIPGIRELRSISRFGLSVVTIVFDDDVDVYWARAQVDQRLIEVQREIPSGAGTPLLAPVTTGLGEIYQYVVKTAPGYESRYTLAELRTLQDWIVRRRLIGTPGIADVSSFGGFLRQTEIALDPARLRSTEVGIGEVIAAINANNANSGGAYIERRSGVQYIRTDGLVRSAEDIAEIVVRHRADQAPVRVRDVATVRDGHAIRYGAMTYNDSSEAVGGIVLMLKGANSSEVITSVKQRIDEISRSLPEGVVIEPFLDRTRLVNKAIGTVSKNLIEGALIVIFVLVLLLGNLRAGLIVASVIPLSMLFAVSMMRLFGVSGNLMSLGALDFGLIVDGAVIIVEAVIHALTSRHAPSGNGIETVKEASIGIRRSAAFGEVIIMMVYVPILALVGIEGKMFRPMAETVIFAVAGAFLLSTTYVPMMSSLLLKPGLRTWSIADRIMGLIERLYRPVQRFSLRNATLTIGATLGAFAFAIGVFLAMGGEFIPQLDEGDFAVEMRLATGQSLAASIDRAKRAAAILEERFPEVERVVGKIGTSEIPLDPMPMESGDLIIVLKDKHEWTSAASREELAAKMQKALEDIPGVEFSFQQPIQMRFNELMTGARQDVVVKIFGDELDSLASIAARIGHLTSGVQGAKDVYVEPVSGLPQITVAIDRAACARLGASVDDVNTAVRTAFAGELVGQVFEGDRRFDIAVRLDSAWRGSVDDLSSLLVTTPAGMHVPITQLARIETIIGPNQIQREDAQRRISVGFNVRGRDVQSIVSELQSRIASDLRLPPGYRITYGGQFENLAAATERLSIAVPVAMMLILFLLYVTFSNARHALMIFTAVPLASIGGIIALALRGMPFSISAGVGFIALFGVAVLNGIVLLAAFRSLHARGMHRPLRIIITGTLERLRPVTMTALVASLGFLPMALSTGDGAEVQRPLATVVIGGLVTSTLLTMILLPILYLVVEKRRAARHARLHVAAVLVLMVGTSVSIQAQPQVVDLDEALRLARANHPSMRIAALNLERSSLERTAAVDVPSTQLTYMGGQYNSTSSDNNITLSQTIPFPAKLMAAADLAEEQYRESTLRQTVTTREVDHAVRRAYLRACLHRERLHRLSMMISVASRTAEAASRRVDVGDAQPLDRLTAETYRTELLARRQQEQTRLQIAYGELGVACGISRELITADTVVTPRIIPALADSVSSPLIDVLEQQLRVAEQASSAASAQFWPDITLGYFNQTLIGTPLPQSNAPPLVAGSSDRFEGFMVGLSMPLWFMPTDARSRQATIDRRIAEQRLRQGAQTITHELRMLRSSITAQRQLLEVYSKGALRDATLLLEQTQRAYELGQASWTEVSMAFRQVLDVQLAEIDARMGLAELLSDYEFLSGQ